MSETYTLVAAVCYDGAQMFLIPNSVLTEEKLAVLQGPWPREMIYFRELFKNGTLNGEYLLLDREIIEVPITRFVEMWDGPL